ncbi:MAG: hypothetical protein QM785_09625 [Pyrinomonadaceae bacterium]
MKYRSVLAFILVLFAFAAAHAQTTALKYQGKLNDSGSAANGNYLMQFKLYDSPSGGSQIGTTLSDVSVNVVDGIFAAQLDFGAAVFGGPNRYIEISVRRTAGESYTTLSPREQITSSPFSVRTLSASQADFATTAGTANTANSANTANTATNFTGNLAGDVTGTQSSTTVARLQGRSLANTAPADGQVLKYNAATSQWRPDTDATSSGGGGISGVTAGTGLTGGGTSGNVTVGIANNGVTNALIADAAVNGAKVADGSITTPKLADGSVTDAKITSVAGSKVTGAVANATNATTAVNFTGPLAGDVSGTQSSTTIANAAVTTSKIADSAITAPKISLGQVVKSLNSLKDDVTLAAGTNITITPTGNTLTIAATGSASGVTGTGTVGTVPLWSGSTAIGNSLISQSAGEINMPSVVRFAPSNTAQMNIGTPNFESGITFTTSSSRADIRYGGGTGNLKIVNGPGGIQGPAFGIAINPSGNVGVGTENSLNAKLTVTGGLGQPGIFSSTDNRGVWGVTTGGSYGVFGESTNGTGIGVEGRSTSNIGTSGLSTSSFGVSGLSGSSSGVRGVTNATNSAVAGVHGTSNGAGGVGVRGDGTTGVYGTSTSGTGVTGESSTGLAMFANGNAGQVRDKGGFVKAMLFVNPAAPANQYIQRCFNGISNVSSSSPGNPSCGFTVTRLDVGAYDISFNFTVNDRYLSVSNGSLIGLSISARFFGPDNNIRVNIAGDGTSEDGTFHLIIY